MRRFLLVGCGGSGGVTLQFVMDQLRADLALRGIGEIPQGWQFVHVDVPVSPDGTGRNMPPTVLAQGGRYVGLAHPGASYPAVAQHVEQRLRQAGQLGQLATWRPNPETIGIPIADGAGQQRAIGRMLALSKSAHVLDQLNAAFAALNAHGVTGQLAEIAERFSPSTKGQVDGAPVVLVVSSMAGGAGASMVLDVCRLLTQIDGYDPRATALFLFTPEVFASLPQHARGGVDGNALAMLGELFAAQAGAGVVGDAAVLRACGLAVTEQSTAPFGRVIPVGARVGASGTPFGDGSAVGVYRGLGRGLAALMLSGQATNEFVAYDVVNATTVPTRQDALGWGLDVSALLWGSFGYASVGLGRERYAEYAAQRLARAAVDRLVEGHLQPGDPRSATDQLRALNDVRWVHFCQQVGLPRSVDDVRGWFVSLLGAAALEAQAGTIVEDVVGRHFQLDQPVDARQWWPVVVRQVAQEGQRLRDRIGAVAYKWAFDWHRALLERLEGEIEQMVVESGLAAAREMLLRIIETSDSWVHTLNGAAAGAPADPHVVRPEVRQRLDAVKGLIDGSHASIELLRSAFRESVLAATRGQCAGKAAEVLQAMRGDLLRPLARSCDEALQVLTTARSTPPTDTGLARLRTDDYASWPEGEAEVPRRFFEAHNELLLTSAEAFPREFDAHVAATEPGRPLRDGLNAIVDQVIRGRWETTGKMTEGSIVERAATFRPGCLPTDPNDASAPPTPARTGQYRIAVKPAELLECAREWVKRPKEPFDAFVSQSLRDYLFAVDSGDAERIRRAQEVHRLFREALELARPLVAVSHQLVTSVHGFAPQTSFKFSDVPFAGLPIGTQLCDELRQHSEIEPTSPPRLEKALRSDSPTTRVDIFGSYGRLSPVVFTSLLGPLDRRWASCVTAEARNEFWKLRRTRRLPGCLPMGDAQRRAIIGGWFVARFTGRLRLAGEHTGEAAEVWDEADRRWVAFPHPLLVETEQYRIPADVLPAVLLSSLVALARSTQFVELEPLRPYTVLRMLWDDTTTGRDPADAATLLAAGRPLGTWLRTGERPAGAPESPADLTTPTTDVEGRRAEMLANLQELREHVGRQYLVPGFLGATGGGHFSTFDRPGDLLRVPLYHELAPDVHGVLTVLVDLVTSINLAAHPAHSMGIKDSALA